MLQLSRDEPEEQTEGGIYLAEQAQRQPVSGIVVDTCPGPLREFIGKRVYFHPHTDLTIPLGGGGSGPVSCFLHKGNIVYVEETEE